MGSSEPDVPPSAALKRRLMADAEDLAAALTTSGYQRERTTAYLFAPLCAFVAREIDAAVKAERGRLTPVCPYCGWTGCMCDHKWGDSCRCLASQPSVPVPPLPQTQEAERREGMLEHVWWGGVCIRPGCGRHLEDEGIRGCNPTIDPPPSVPSEEPARELQRCESCGLFMANPRQCIGCGWTPPDEPLDEHEEAIEALGEPWLSSLYQAMRKELSEARQALEAAAGERDFYRKRMEAVALAPDHVTALAQVADLEQRGNVLAEAVLGFIRLGPHDQHVCMCEDRMRAALGGWAKRGTQADPSAHSSIGK